MLRLLVMMTILAHPTGTQETTRRQRNLTDRILFAFATSATNALGWTPYSQFDYFTGAAVNSEDINGVISRTLYNDSLDRPTQSFSAVGTAHETQSNIIYDDANRRVETKGDLYNLNDNLSKSERFYDGLGGTIETRNYKDGGYVVSKQVFDALGRVEKATNPYRPCLNETAVWTKTKYDALGRVTEIETPDGAKVKTAYHGTRTLVTDQAGKQRISRTNALGQLKDVWEAAAADSATETLSFPNQTLSAGYKTSYSYDTLNNLTTVNQSVQTRSFSYNSLSRLLSATNPESGVIQYVYDNNGNLTKKTDARGIETNYTYDALNRVIQRTYANEPGGQDTPDVTYSYDNLPNAKGKLTKVSSSVSTTEYTAFDTLGRVLSHEQTTDGHNYTTGYAYNLSGALIEETYPSGRVVKNVLDIDGDLSLVQSKKNQNFGYHTYASSFTYTAAGAVGSMQLGNGKWESTQFNSRLQPTQIALGTVQSGADKLKLDYSYGTTTNNGNVQSQAIAVPTVGTNQGFTATQTYTYDSLNRLKDAKEMIGTTEAWKQTFVYDRYGNRSFDTTNNNTTTLPPGCPVNLCNPTVNPANSRLNGYSFDNTGNTTTDAENRAFIYDAENKQIEVRDKRNNLIGQYAYNGDGKRVKKSVPNGETVIFVYNAAGKLVAEYGNQVSRTPEANYLTSDYLGSPRINTDGDGNITARHDYHPFGEEIVRSGGRTAAWGYAADDVRKKFTGYERDMETDLDFAQARYFASGFGRFSSPDALMASARRTSPQTFNRYSYVVNNPFRFTDPTGLYECPPNCREGERVVTDDGIPGIMRSGYGTALLATVQVNASDTPSIIPPLSTTNPLVSSTITPRPITPLEQGPSVSDAQSEPSRTTFGYGGTVGGSGVIGLTGGIADTTDVSGGFFYDSNRQNAFVQGAALEYGLQAHPPLGVSPLVTVATPPAENTPFTFGRSAGVGVGGFVTNAGSPEQLGGPFYTRQLNTPAFSAQYSSASDGTWVFSLTFGPAVGGSYWQGTTNTVTSPSMPVIPTTPMYIPRVR